MPYRYVTHPNGSSERLGNPTPEEEREFFKRITGVVRFPSIDHRLEKKAKPDSKSMPRYEEASSLKVRSKQIRRVGNIKMT